MPADGSDDYSEDSPLDVNVQCCEIYSREGACIDSAETEPGEDCVPVILFHSHEKGSFGVWFVETEGVGFDVKKFSYTVCETNLGSVLEDAYYGREKLERDCDYDYSVGKCYMAEVGWLNMRYREDYDSAKKAIDEELEEWLEDRTKDFRE